MSESIKDIDKDLKLFEVLKPFIGHCLTLNHDINNPLAGIMGYCEFLIEESDNFTESQKGYLRQILTCAERIKNQVEGLCAEKIELDEKIDLRTVTEAYQKIAGPK